MEAVQEEVIRAFANADSTQEECADLGLDDDAEAEECRDEQHMANQPADGDGGDSNFSGDAIEDCMQHLYEGAQSTKLAATVLLMNLCTVHGVSNQCANELFSILHRHLLPELSLIH